MLVEAAIMMPLLLLLTFAILEYGWVYIKAQQLRNSASMAARVGSLAPEVEGESMTTKAMNHLDEMLTEYGLGTASVTFEPASFDDVERGEAVKVTVSVDYGGTDLELVGFPLIPVPGSLSAEATFAKQ
jgi:Flp pilus assembly protein TadG